MAPVLLASVGYGGRVDGDAVRRLKEAFDMPFIMHLCEVCRSHIRVSRALSAHTGPGAARGAGAKANEAPTLCWDDTAVDAIDKAVDEGSVAIS